MEDTLSLSLPTLKLRGLSLLYLTHHHIVGAEGREWKVPADAFGVLTSSQQENHWSSLVKEGGRDSFEPRSEQESHQGAWGPGFREVEPV